MLADALPGKDFADRHLANWESLSNDPDERDFGRRYRAFVAGDHVSIYPKFESLDIGARQLAKKRRLLAPPSSDVRN